MFQKSNSILEFQAHICWVITVDYKVRLAQLKSEFDWKRPKLTRSVRASKLSIFSIKFYTVGVNVEKHTFSHVYQGYFWFGILSHKWHK